jgi:DNA-binding response OmpR family regulator
LRKKIEADLSQPDFIKTVRGGGYVFAVAVTSD